MTAEVVVIVPVLGRPHHAASFMSSLRGNTPEGRATVVAVMSEADPLDDKEWDQTWDAWDLEGVGPAIAIGSTFAEKVNYAYKITSEPWLLLVGSDVEFKPGWLTSALITAGLTGAKLVATNDLGNPGVLAGTHATHPLISRQWIDEHGASWDGPGIVACEEYRHQWVDAEWSRVAIDAGVFAFSPLSIIEHYHPKWGKAESDDTYRIGEASEAADRALFFERVAKYGRKVA